MVSVAVCGIVLSILGGVTANHLSPQGTGVVNGRRILPRNPAAFNSNTRSRSSSSRGLRGRLPVITSRELRTILQARRIRENLRRAQAQQRTQAQQTQAQGNNLNSQSTQNNRLNFSPQQLAFLTALFGGTGRLNQNNQNNQNNPTSKGSSQGSNLIDPRVAFGGHQSNGPPLQIKNQQQSANPFVIEAKGAIKVSEIKGPNGQTQVIIDASANQVPKVPANMVTLKPGEDPPEVEMPRLPGLLGALI